VEETWTTLLFRIGLLAQIRVYKLQIIVVGQYNENGNVLMIAPMS